MIGGEVSSGVCGLDGANGLITEYICFLGLVSDDLGFEFLFLALKLFDLLFKMTKLFIDVIRGPNA